MFVAASRNDLKDTSVERQQANIEGTPSEIVHKDVGARYLQRI